MSEISEKQQKKPLKNKHRVVKKQVLESSAKHIYEQLEFASKSDSRASYKKYIENQIKSTKDKI